MQLGLAYILIASFLIIVLIFPLYVYKAKKTKNKKRIIDIQFAKQLRTFLRKRYPTYRFKFLKAGRIKSQNKQIAQVLLVESLAKQFANFSFELRTQKTIENNKLWESYQNNSVSNTKLPSDWPRRRELVWQRDEKVCQRCKRSLKLDEVQIFFLRNIEDGGTYYFENMLELCIDCSKILSTPQGTSVWQTLPLYDELMDFVKN